MTELIVNFVLNLVKELGYLGIFLMMTLESSFIPFPSEIAMIPAGYHASLGDMNIYLAFLAGTLGALFGATINYFLGMKLGGPVIKTLIDKYGKYILLSKKHYSQAESFFQKHGGVTTFNARFIPAVRQLISIPAGVFKYNFPKFLFLTGIGAGIWNIILLTIGYIAGENKELITKYSHEAIIGTIFL
ncbi:MAG: DedA family protein, partial [Candidatus Gracilibacteria bacterium]|nr:DedA family protein [Candidatus Gracilibacteria bacterium]